MRKTVFIDRQKMQLGIKRLQTTKFQILANCSLSRACCFDLWRSPSYFVYLHLCFWYSSISEYFWVFTSVQVMTSYSAVSAEIFTQNKVIQNHKIYDNIMNISYFTVVQTFISSFLYSIFSAASSNHRALNLPERFRNLKRTRGGESGCEPPDSGVTGPVYTSY